MKGFSLYSRLEFVVSTTRTFLTQAPPTLICAYGKLKLASQSARYGGTSLTSIVQSHFLGWPSTKPGVEYDGTPTTLSVLGLKSAEL